MKTCSLCREAKDFSFFSKASVGDGYQNYCKPCAKIKKDAWDKQNAPHVQQYQKKWAKENPEKLKALQRRMSVRQWEKFPEKRKARTAVSNAIRDGRLQKQPCWVCGENAQAHHVCYKDPMMISWLCREHHRQAHEVV